MLGQAVLGADVPYIAGSLILLVVLTTLASGMLYLLRWTAGYDVTAARGNEGVTGECLHANVSFPGLEPSP